MGVVGGAGQEVALTPRDAESAEDSLLFLGRAL
jgi:hypothetical protein